MDVFPDFVLPDDQPEDWTRRRARISARVLSYFGKGPDQPPPLDPDWGPPERQDGCIRRRVSYQIEAGQRAPAYVFLPEKLPVPAPVVMCYHGTGQIGKEAVSGVRAGSAYAPELARRGYVTMAPDQWATGERAGQDDDFLFTTKLYERHPHWSIEGKTAWDHARALDLLAHVPEADVSRVGATGHSRGGRATLYHMLLDPRVKVGVPSCGTPPMRCDPQLGRDAAKTDFISFPKAQQEILKGRQPGFDIHEVIALLAPRPVLLVSPFVDQYCAHGKLLSELAEKVAALYRFVGAGNNFTRFVHGEGHNTGPILRSAMYAFFDYHLRGEVPGLPGRNFAQHAPGVTGSDDPR